MASHQRSSSAYRTCFLREVERDPEAQGSLAVSIVLDGNRKVVRVDMKPTGHLSALLVACCRSRVFVVPFSPPEDRRPATLSFVATFMLLPPATASE